ncbi:IclR family transcriptional regulator [Rhodococcus sp. D2-41]|uniref:IclR family transcriptional regulator n=1 Tax=Speluncibacter jeojiensis TaxID=2710754 RepID=UPI0024107D06|nr:IclR family transcriptional regulator [Rhodococcus sp. D2-41]MDG3012918.1 IclR family transcriptional regulator [Rhodococcus sp. D2-41]
MVERMTLILDAFDRRSTRLSLEDVAARTRLPRSTAHRILDQLVRLHWVDHTALGYGLGRRALRLSGNDGAHGEIRQAAAPHLHELQVRTGMVVHLAVLDGSDQVFLDKLGGRFASTLDSRVGGRTPAHTTTGGRAMLAWLDPERVDTLVRPHLGRPESAAGWTLGGLHQELNRIRRHHGLSLDRTGVMNRNITSLAVAVRGPEGPVAAISACPESRQIPLERIAPLVVETARRTTADLFPQKATAAAV